MPNHNWNAIKCVDCHATIAYSPYPVKCQSSSEWHCYNPVYCYLCAHAHAQVATWLLPLGNNLSTNYLYGMSKTGNAQTLRARFAKVWSSLYAKLEDHRVAKVNKKLHANKITP